MLHKWTQTESILGWRSKYQVSQIEKIRGSNSKNPAPPKSI
jgi:hypothetical protein